MISIFFVLYVKNNNIFSHLQNEYKKEKNHMTSVDLDTGVMGTKNHYQFKEPKLRTGPWASITTLNQEKDKNHYKDPAS